MIAASIDGTKMDPITVDRAKCKKDGLCVAECPAKIIGLGEDGQPEAIPGAGELCLDCGHCVAVCRFGAMSQRTMAAGLCPPVRPEWRLSPDQAEHFLRSRRSARQYKDKPVEREKLARLIEIARYAPSGHNAQPVHWLVVTDPAEVHRQAGLVIDWMRHMVEHEPALAESWRMNLLVQVWDLGLDLILRGAPNLVVAHASRANPFALAAGVTALAYLELAAPSLGLGTCWAGFFQTALLQYEPLRRALDLPEDHVALGAVMVGYPKASYFRLPLRKAPPITWR